MTHGINLHDGTGSLANIPGYGGVLNVGIALPANGTAGYEPGDLFWYLGTGLYLNSGSVTSCLFEAVNASVIDLSGLTSTVAELNQLHSQPQPKFVSGNTPVVVGAATTTLTLTPALHAGRLTIVAPTGGLTITPPAPAGTGDVYEIVTAAAPTGGSLVLDCKSTGVGIYGWCQTLKSGTGFTAYNALPTVSAANRVTYNGTTTGGAGAAGDTMRITDVSATAWRFEGFSVNSGTIATPFDTH